MGRLLREGKDPRLAIQIVWRKSSAVTSGIHHSLPIQRTFSLPIQRILLLRLAFLLLAATSWAGPTNVVTAYMAGNRVIWLLLEGNFIASYFGSVGNGFFLFF